MQSQLITAFDLNERLFAAVQSGHYDEVLRCLINGAKATLVSGTCGRTAVGIAAFLGNSDILKLLIQSCEEPDLALFRRERPTSMDMDIGSTPDEMHNLEWEDEFSARTSAASDEEHNEPDRVAAEHSALYFYYARTFERTGSIMLNFPNQQAVLQQDPHTIDALLMTPLHYAAACGNVDCVRILLEHGARVDDVNSDGYTPLHVGIKSEEVTRILLEHGANANLKSINSGETAVHLALRNASEPVVKLLLEAGGNLNLNQTDDQEQTYLMCSIASGLSGVALQLIERGARLNLQDKEGRTALYYAVMQNDVRLAGKLLRKGARRITSHYLLHYCVHYDFKAMAELLLQYEDNLNVRNKDGLTPILLAIIVQKPAMLELLLKTAAEQTQRGKTVIDHIDNELVIAVQYLESGAEFEPIARVLFAHSDARWMISAASPPPSCYIPYCQTPLARAIMLNRFDIAEFLIKEGVDVTLVCREHVVGNIRLSLAPGYYELCNLLVHSGFRFPYMKSMTADQSVLECWKPQRYQFEKDMRQLCTNPLSLQSIVRIAIRLRLIRLVTAAEPAQMAKYQSTANESTLSLMIKDLGVPPMLQHYLKDFHDCPTVSGRMAMLESSGGAKKPGSSGRPAD